MPSPSLSSWPELGVSMQLSILHFSSWQARSKSGHPSRSLSGPQSLPSPAQPILHLQM